MRACLVLKQKTIRLFILLMRLIVKRGRNLVLLSVKKERYDFDELRIGNHNLSVQVSAFFVKRIMKGNIFVQCKKINFHLVKG